MENFKSDAFIASIVLPAGPKSLLASLQTNPFVLELRENFCIGNITGKDIENFLEEILSDPNLNLPFLKDRTIAAIVVALSEINDDYVKGFFQDLEQIDPKKLPFSRGIFDILSREKDNE